MLASADARRIHERALAIREARLGPDHPDTAYSLMNLGKVLRDEGELDQARQLLQRALTIFEAEGGAGSVNTAGVLHDLAGILQRDGDLDGARRLYERALLFRRSSLGASHPQIVRGQSVTEDLDRARRLWSDLIRAGIDEEEVGEQLETEGVDKFATSYQAMLDTIEANEPRPRGRESPTARFGSLPTADGMNPKRLQPD